MRLTSRVLVARALGMSLISAVVVRCVWEVRQEASPTVAACPAPPNPPRCPAAVALRRARRARMHAQLAVNQERYQLEAWDPDGTVALDYEAWRLQLLACDRTGDLAKARTEALRSLGLAATPAETGSALELLVIIEHEAGLHADELAHVQKLTAIQPHADFVRPFLLRAVRCNPSAALHPQGKAE